MIVAGIDYSMNSPAIAVYNTVKEFKFENILLYNINTIKKYSGVYNNIRIDLQKPFSSPEERFLNNASWAIDILLTNKVESVILEGYSMGSNSGLIIQIAENGSVLKQGMHLAKIAFQTPSPKTVKKCFSGSGNAKKEDMILEFENKFNIDIGKIIGQNNKNTSPCNDLVDAVAMLHWGNQNGFGG